MTRRLLFTLLACGLLLAPAVRAAAQAPPQEPPVLKLQLEKGEDLGIGSLAVTRGVAAAEPVRMSLDGLSAYQPVAVVAATLDPATPVKVTLAKFDWNEELKSATTDPKTAVAKLQVRTQGEMRIKVVSANGVPTPFVLTVWAGDETTPVPEPMLLPVKAYKSGEGAATATPPPSAGTAGTALVSRWLMPVGVGLGAVVVLGLGIVLGRRTKGGKVS